MEDVTQQEPQSPTQDDENTETEPMAEEQAPAVQDAEAPQDAAPAAEGEKDSLLAELEQARREALANLEGWQRARAEFTNYKRRVTQELADSKQRGALDALAQVLPIMDDFERALANIPEEMKDHPWMNGTALILKNMQKVLDNYDIEIMDPVGEEFDPNFHEAVGMDDSGEYESGTITMTMQKGYRSGDKVLRPALVRVAN